MATYNIPNSIQINSLNAFRAITGKHRDFAKVAKFAVQIVKSDAIEFSSELSFLCESAELPGRAFHLGDVRYYGPSFKMPFQSVYENTTLTFFCRDKFWEKQFFDEWMNQINPKSTYNFEYRDNYVADSLNIYQYSEVASSSDNMVATYFMSLRKAYPINVNPMPLAWAEDNIHRLQVTFAYTDWVTLQDTEVEGYDIVPGASMTGTRLPTAPRL